MSLDLVTLLYLVASVCFIQALKGLSHPTTSIRGNLFGMIGMTIAVLTTVALIHGQAQALGINQPATPRGVPVVYELDFSDAANVFAATNMEVMPEDVIYVPLAGAAEMRKFFEVVQSLTRVVYDVSVTSTLNNN